MSEEERRRRNRERARQKARRKKKKKRALYLPVFASDHSSGRRICLPDIVYRCSEQRKSGAWPE